MHSQRLPGVQSTPKKQRRCHSEKVSFREDVVQKDNSPPAQNQYMQELFLGELILARIHAGPVFALARIQENIFEDAFSHFSANTCRACICTRATTGKNSWRIISVLVSCQGVLESPRCPLESPFCPLPPWSMLSNVGWSLSLSLWFDWELFLSIFTSLDDCFSEWPLHHHFGAPQGLQEESDVRRGGLNSLSAAYLTLACLASSTAFLVLECSGWGVLTLACFPSFSFCDPSNFQAHLT